MKKKIVTIIATMTMIMATMLAGCGSDTTTDTKDVNKATETVETTENISDTADVVESTESTESDTESESADVSAAGCEFTSIVFDENEVPYFVNAIDSYQDTECRNEKYSAVITNDTEYSWPETDLESIVVSKQESWEDYKAMVGEDEMDMTYELVTIGDYPFIKTTYYHDGNEAADMEASVDVFYDLPLQYNGEYVHNKVFSVVRFYSCYGAPITEQEVLEALELLY